MTINELIHQAMTNARTAPPPRYAYVAPTYRQAKEIAWDYLQHYTAVVPGMDYHEAELRATFANGARIRLAGALNADALRGPYLDGVVLDEYGYMDPDVYAKVIRPMLSDYRGFAIFIGTPVGRNDFFRKYTTARQDASTIAAFYPASLTGYIPDEELALARADMTESAYAQEYECSFEAAIQGAYYAKELADARTAGRIRTVEWEPNVPVDTWWDLGFTDATAIVFTQRIGREIHVIDYVEARFEKLAFYAKAIKERPYVYGRHELPHDANQTEMGTGLSLVAQMRALGLQGLQVGRPSAVQEGIQQARTLFPRVWFDERKCERLLDCLATYRTGWDPKRQDYRDKPEHDWASHAADAFRYMAVGTREVREMPRQTYATSTSTVNPWDAGRRPVSQHYATSSTRWG